LGAQIFKMGLTLEISKPFRPKKRVLGPKINVGNEKKGPPTQKMENEKGF